MTAKPQLHAVLVTFRRPEILANTLDRVLGQTQPLAALHVVDNEPSEAVRQVVQKAAVKWPGSNVTYVPAPENLGPAGGWALGMQRLLGEAGPDDWIVILDDNDPPESDTDLEAVFQLARTRQEMEGRLGGVGIIGARFDWRTGLIRRVPDQELKGAVPVDYLGGGFLSMYSVRAIQEVGAFASELFFGFVELEFGLRLRRAGFTLLAHGELWLRRRDMWGHRNMNISPSRMCKVHWQKYYRIRNYISMMLAFGRRDLAFRWALIQCVAKPLYSCFRSPPTGCRGFVQALRASRDGFFHRLGRTLEPPSGPPSRH